MLNIEESDVNNIHSVAKGVVSINTEVKKKIRT